MKLAIFYSELRGDETTLQRLKADKVGVILVGNGIYHATLKEGGEPSTVLKKDGAEYYVLSEDLETRGFNSDQVDDKVSIINYDQLADLIMNDYEKLVWL
ncbi:MAG: hypothetical protein D6828_04055 [Nitrospirae bacterium]|nr:MAG: hypothetical protein D6828_04055 [Nitrospirota bacterium]